MRNVLNGRRTNYCCRLSVILLLVIPIGAVSAASPSPLQIHDATNTTPAGPEDLIENLPLDAAARASLSAAVRNHHYIRAEQIVLGAIKQNPKSPQLLSFLGGIYFLYGDYLECAVAMKKADALAPLSNPDRFTLAMAYVVLNHSDWAQPEVERLARSDPRNPLYFYWLSRISYNQNHFDQGVAEAQKAIQLDSGFTRAYDDLGLCYEALGKYDLAIQSYRSAIALNREGKPPSPWPPLDLGALLVKLNKLNNAEPFLEEALHDDPRFPEAHFRLGLLLQAEGREDDAIRQFKTAAALNPNYAEPHYALGRAYERMGNQRQARAEFALFERLKQANLKRKPR